MELLLYRYYDMVDFYGDPKKYLKTDLDPEEKIEKIDRHKQRLKKLRGGKRHKEN